MFVSEPFGEADAHRNLLELCAAISTSVSSSTLGSHMCTELVFDVEVLRPVGEVAEAAAKAAAAPVKSYMKGPRKTAVLPSFAKRHKNMVCYFRSASF